MGAQPNKVINWVEKRGQKGRHGPIQPLPADDETIIACEDIPKMEFRWTGREIREFLHMWEEGLSLYDIARAFPDRNPDDVLWLWLHCDYHGWIKDRPGGVYGRRRPPEKGEDHMIEIWANWLDHPAEFMRQCELFWIDGEEV